MNISSILKKEGITIVEELDTFKVNIIAKSVSSKLCLAFPEHNLKLSDLFSSFSRLNMYIADMPDNLGGAKYFSKINSIYFSENIPFDDLPDIAVHECIHFVQEVKSDRGNLVNMGLYDMRSGLGLNEAATQLMASEANFLSSSEETYFNISLNTISPDYYPLECALVSQIAHFIGTYPLYHSALNSNDVFKNTTVARIGAKSYNRIVSNLDKLIKLESDLNFFAKELQFAERMVDMKLLSNLIANKKNAIIALFFSTQNMIMRKFFTFEFNNIVDMNALKEFKRKLYDFKDVIGSTHDYEYYNVFYRQMMEAAQAKEEYIEEHGELNLLRTNATTALAIVDNRASAFSFATTFFKKL
ncbi:MAG: hypothetical protein FWC68_05235, partial [Oscillospiraceae bacterium]|nr:hypothetical protein [Oscillospiraceae bacterium]